MTTKVKTRQSDLHRVRYTVCINKGCGRSYSTDLSAIIHAGDILYKDCLKVADIKIRKMWSINPVTRVKPSGKIYKRNKYKQLTLEF